MERNCIVLLCIRVFLGIAVIYTVNHSSLHYDISLNFCRTKSRCCVCAEERVACSATEYYYSALLKVKTCFVSDVRLCNLMHSDSCLNTNINSKLFECITNTECIDCCCKHTHMVGSCSVHFT